MVGVLHDRRRRRLQLLQIAAAGPARFPLRTRLTILFQDERFDQSDRLRYEAISCNGLRFTIDNGYLEIEYDGAAAIGFGPSQGPREKWCHEPVLLCSCLSASITPTDVGRPRWPPPPRSLFGYD
jgi:hypothetical protein